MGRSHPPTLITIARRALRQECGVAKGHCVLVAVSGGGDSQALLHVLASLRDRMGFSLFAHGVDHGLREEAPAELELARSLAERCGVDFTTSRLSLKDGGNLQARAREGRFRALRHSALQVGASVIATAHHADDRAETLLLRLARGAGPRGLAVLPARDADLVRPLIRARKAQILAHLVRHGIESASDPSNGDRRFARVRARLDVLPALESLSPRIVDHLCTLADQLVDDSPPVLVLEDGEPLDLGRAQQEAIRLAIARKSTKARVRLPGGRELSLDHRGIVAVSKPTPSGCRKSRGLPNR